MTLTLKMFFSKIQILPSSRYVMAQFMPITCVSGNTALSDFYLSSATADTSYPVCITKYLRYLANW